MSVYGKSSGTFDCVRCQRADGSFYGTSGKCRKGREVGDFLNRLLKEEKQWGVLRPNEIESISKQEGAKSLGAGAFGTVYDVGGGVVVKTGSVEMEEVETLEKLNGIEGVPRVVAHNVSEGGRVLGMTKMKGEPLANLVKENGTYALLEGIEAALPVLKKINERGVAHLDIHSGNILYDETTKKASIIDFGIVSRENNHKLMVSAAEELHSVLAKGVGELYSEVRTTKFMKDFPKIKSFMSSVNKFKTSSPELFGNAYKMDSSRAKQVWQDIFKGV